MTFDDLTIKMWDLFPICYQDKPSPKTISHAIVNAPILYRCNACGNAIVPQVFSVEAKYCPCCNARIEELVIANDIDCERRIAQLGLIF